MTSNETSTRKPGGWKLVPVEPTEEMLSAALDASGARIMPYTAPRESGVATECDMPDEDAERINKETMNEIANQYRAMIGAAPVMTDDLNLGLSRMSTCTTCRHWDRASFGTHGYCTHPDNLGTAPATGQKLRRGTKASAMAMEMLLRRMKITDATVHGFRSELLNESLMLSPRIP